MKKRLISLFAAASVVSLASCNTNKKEALVFHIGTTQKVEKAVYGEYAYDMLASGVSEIPMVYQSATGEFSPLLCSWRTEDSKSWTFTVEQGMTWSDGVPVTAEDILFTLQYEDKQGSANLVDQTDKDGKVTAKKYEGYTLSEDKRSITLVLSKANVRELSNMTSFRIAPKHVLENKENPTDEDLRITAGPYVLTEFNATGGYLIFEKNSYYPIETKADEITFRLYSNDDVLYTDLSNGNLDYTWGYSTSVPSDYQEKLKTNEKISLASVDAVNAPAVFAMNNSKGLFSDENVRLAVSYALDYEQFKNTFGSDAAKVSSRGFVSRTTYGYTETEESKKDLAKALSYMEKSGYQKGTTYYEKNGEIASFKLTVNSSKAAHVRYAELVKTQLESFGIAVVLDSCDGNTFNFKCSNKFSENNITMEACINGFTAAGMGMMDGLGTIYMNGNHAVQGGCQVFDSEFQSILKTMNEAKTPEAYTIAAGNMQKWYAAHTPAIALYNDAVVYAYSSSLKGMEFDAVFGINSIPNWTALTK